MAPAAPFGAGSVSLGLHPMNVLSAQAQAATLLHQAHAAEGSGFDGVTISEHHDGVPGYLPQPLLATTWMLENTNSVWSGPFPMLLPLRHPVLVAEELAWMSARFPGRFGAALAPGYAPGDFVAFGLLAATRFETFARGLAHLRRALSAEGPISADPAVRTWIAEPAPLLSAANSRAAVERAAVLGVGIVYPGGADAVRTGALTSIYRDAGGAGPVVCIRNVWLGEPPEQARTELEAVFRRIGSPTRPGAPGFDEPLVSGDDASVAERLLATVATAGATAINIRFHLPGVEIAQVDEQIRGFGEGVLPALRNATWPRS